MDGYAAESAKTGRPFLAQIPFLLDLLMHLLARDVYPGLVGFLAMASCPQWLRNQTAEVSFVFAT
jgi:hypothetical protein